MANAPPFGKAGSTAPCPWEHFFEEIAKFPQISHKINSLKILNLLSVNKHLFFPNFQYLYDPKNGKISHSVMLS